MMQMKWVRRHLRRIGTDAAGYLLLLAALLTGWLPGPGGIPLALAGLWLLSMYNPWARRLRRYVVGYGGGFVSKLVFGSKLLRTIYDIAILLLLSSAAVLFWRHGAHWQVALGSVLVGVAIGLGFLGWQRYSRLLSPFKRKR